MRWNLFGNFLSAQYSTVNYRQNVAQQSPRTYGPFLPIDKQLSFPSTPGPWKPPFYSFYESMLDASFFYLE